MRVKIKYDTAARRYVMWFTAPDGTLREKSFGMAADAFGFAEAANLELECMDEVTRSAADVYDDRRVAQGVRNVMEKVGAGDLDEVATWADGKKQKGGHDGEGSQGREEGARSRPQPRAADAGRDGRHGAD